MKRLSIHIIFLFVVMFCFLNGTAQNNRIDSLLKQSKTLQNDSLLANIYNEIAFHYFQNNEYKLSAEFAEKSITKCNTNENSRLLGKNLLILSHIYSSQKQYAIAIKYNIRAINVYNKIKDESILSKIYIQLGINYKLIEIYDKAIENLNEAKNRVSKLNDENQQIFILENIASCYLNLNQYDSALKTYFELLTILRKKNNNNLLIKPLQNIIRIYKTQKNYNAALDTYNEILRIFSFKKDTINIANTINNIGNLYVLKGEYKKALSIFKQTMISDSKSKIPNDEKAKTFINIGICYQNMHDFENAVSNLLKALKIRQTQNDKTQIAQLQNLIALIYLQKNDYYNAAIHSQNSIENAKQTNNLQLLQFCYQTYSRILHLSNEDDKALEYYQLFLNIKDSLIFNQRMKEQEVAQKQYIIEKTEKEVKLHIADEENKDLALKQLKLESEKKEKELELLRRNTELKEMERQRAIQSLILTRQQHEAEIRDQKIKSLQQEKEIQDLELKKKEAEDKEKQKEILLLQKDKENQKLQIEKQEEQKRHFLWLFLLFLVIFGLILFSLIYAVKTNKTLTKQKKVIQQKNEDLEQKNEEISAQKESLEIANEEIKTKNSDLQLKSEEILAQNEEIIAQKTEIEKKNRSITDSILYAKRIQTAILPPEEVIKQCFNEYFILFKPRDIVSGDFFWMKQYYHYLVISAADCTGHGVPGAFMSMLGISYLNEIINKYLELRNVTNLKANVILNELRIHVKKSLHQTGKDMETKDGMDMALCIINTANNKMQFAGANNPAWLIRNTEKSESLNDLNPEFFNTQTHENWVLIELKADSMPIGIHLREKDFTNIEFQLHTHDTIYLFSDGFKDQFGGKDGRKYLSKNLKKLFLSIQNESMNRQKEIIEKTHEDWKGKHEQLDDVLIVGVKI